jgi:MFS family permease
LIMRLKKDPRDVGKDLQAYWPKEAFSQAELAPVETKRENVKKGRSVFQLLAIWPLLLSIFLRIFIHLGANFVNMALPLAFTEMGYTLSVIGIFMTLRALGAFVAATQTGQLIDKYGRKLGFIGAPVATIIGILLVGMTTNIVCIVVGVIMIGVGNAIANVVPPAVANDVTTLEERSTAVAIFGISTNIGGFIFPVPMALVLARYGLGGLAIACGIFLLIPTILGIFVKETAATKVKA